MRLLGIDGCRGGWLIATATAASTGVASGAAASERTRTRTPSFGVTVTVTGLEVVGRLRDGLTFGTEPRCETDETDCRAGDGAWLAAIDMPIGLLDTATPGGRDCDRAARRLLGPRRSSVFSPPIRRALTAANYAEAKVRNGGMTIQTWNIVARIAELDRLVTPDHPVHEAHPELAFLHLSGGVPLAPKRTALGRAERTALLAEHLPGAEPHLSGPRPRGVAPDDVCDALVLCLTAARIAAATALCVPEGPVPTDARGLPMLVWW